MNPVVRMKPPLESRNDGKLQPGTMGWTGTELPNGYDPAQPRKWDGMPDTFACCPGKGDRVCLECGKVWCPHCCPVAGTRANCGGTCPGCGAGRVFRVGSAGEQETLAPKPHPKFRGF